MNYRILISLVLMFSAAATIVALVAVKDLEWSPIMRAQMAILAACLLAMGMLSMALARQRAGRQIGNRERELEDLVDHTIVAALGGILTGVVFVAFYYLVDFSGVDKDLSERNVDQVCARVGWPPFAPDPGKVVPRYPKLSMLVPEIVTTGALLGLVIGYLLPKWQRLLTTRLPRLALLKWWQQMWIGYMTFGALWGVSLGMIFNVFIFAKSDGRPFLRIDTAIAAASMSVVGYVLLEAIRLWKKVDSKIATDLFGVLVAGFAAASLGSIIDQGFMVSERAYCHFYSAWDTTTNRLQTTPKVLFVAALYGLVLGVVVMVIVSAYGVVRTIHERAVALRRA